MRAMTRQELAVRAGVDRKTLYNYFERHKEELWSLGVRPNQIVPPCAVEWLSDNYGINIDDWEWGSALPDFCNFASVKASEPKVRHFRPVLTSSLRCSDVIYDPFRWYFRGVKYRIYDRKVTYLRAIGTFRTTAKWYTLRHHWLTV